VVADRQDGDIGLVEPPDQLHVAEHAGVAGGVDAQAVLELHDDAGWLADVRAVRGRARVERVREGEAQAVDLARAALAHAAGRSFRVALLLEPGRELEDGHERRLVLLSDRRRVGDVVEVPVRDDDHVRAFDRFLAVRALRVLEPRVEVDALAAGTVDAEGRMSEPGQRRIRHGSSLVECSRRE